MEPIMITAMVQMSLPPGITVAEAAELFKQTAPEYRAMPGLIRKYCMFGDNGVALAVCLWESREAAEASFNDDWLRQFSARYGAAPSVTYFATPIIVDNALGVIEGDAISSSFGIIAGNAAE